MSDSHSIPKIALTAAALLVAAQQRDNQTLVSQTLESMGLDASWHLDFQSGIASKPPTAGNGDT